MGRQAVVVDENRGAGTGCLVERYVGGIAVKGNGLVGYCVVLLSLFMAEMTITWLDWKVGAQSGFASCLVFKGRSHARSLGRPVTVHCAEGNRLPGLGMDLTCVQTWEPWISANGAFPRMDVLT